MGQVGVDDGGPCGDPGVARHTNPPWSNGREATSHTLPHRGVSCHLFYTVVPSFFTDLLQKVGGGRTQDRQRGPPRRRARGPQTEDQARSGGGPGKSFLVETRRGD